MARQLGMRTVAEGVEDQADWDFVRSGWLRYRSGLLHRQTHAGRGVGRLDQRLEQRPPRVGGVRGMNVAAARILVADKSSCGTDCSMNMT